MITTASTSKILNELIEVCKDGQEGFLKASEHIKTSEFKTVLSGYSLQRSKLAGELQAMVIGLGESEEKTSSFSSSLHRGWIDLKSALTRGDDHSIFAECERGEDHAVAAYREALEEELPANVRDTLTTQYETVLATHNAVRDQRNALAD